MVLFDGSKADTATTEYEILKINLKRDDKISV